MAPGRPRSRHAGRVAELEPKARHALGVMESRLNDNEWLVADVCTIADYALYPYTCTAGRVDFDIAEYRASRNGWRASRPSRTSLRSEVMVRWRHFPLRNISGHESD